MAGMLTEFRRPSFRGTIPKLGLGPDPDIVDPL
jgi:hypothetical protein